MSVSPPHMNDGLSPRVRGNPLYFPPGGSTTGLSPRVRGNPVDAVHEYAHGGSIPASAGEPETPNISSCCTRVYPRECGGTCAGCYRRLVGQGLSPRVRGNLLSVITCWVGGGSIPASAGEPVPAIRPALIGGVYPRECGGTFLYSCAPQYDGGLSPRVRGNPSATVRQGLPRRSIPASAGEPGPRAPVPQPQPVYPRECGGTISIESLATMGLGLSPRVRGNRRRPPPQYQCERSIPASAGEPTLR